MAHHGFKQSSRIRNSLWFICFINLSVYVEFIAAVPDGTSPSFLVTPPPTEQGREGGSLLLRCVADGVPSPVVTWFRNGLIVTNGANGIESANGDLRIESLRRSHSGKYLCRAQNLEGQIQHITRVFVSAPPVFYVIPENAVVREGRSAEFNCLARGYPAEIEYRWYHNSKPVVRPTPSDSMYDIFDEGTLVIHEVKITDRGLVTCEATNGFGSPPKASAQLTVEFAARASAHIPSIVYVAISRKVKMRCPSIALPPVNKVLWNKDGKELRFQQDPRLTTDGNGSLIVHSARQQDEGQYTCTPFNSIGSIGESKPTRLIVRQPPSFHIQPPSKIEAKVGGQLEIPCIGIGDPPPVVSWRKFQRKSAGELGFCVEGGSLIVKAVRKHHHGLWKCLLSNAVEDVTTDVMIVVTHSSPQPVENVTAIAINESSIRVTWDPGFNGGFPQHFIIWSKDKDKESHAWMKTYVSGHQKSVVIYEMKPSTIFQFSISPENSKGVGEFSETVTARTKNYLYRTDVITTTSLPPQDIPVPGNLTSSTNEEGHVILSWNLASSINDFLGFLVEYRSVESDPIDLSQQDVDLTSLEEVTFTKLRSKSSDSNAWQETNKSSVEPLLSRHKRSPVTNEWQKLDTTSSNVMSYEIQPHQAYRDNIYEFRVLAVSTTQYSEPSQPLTVSTQGLSAYPIFIEPLSASPFILEHPLIVGFIIGLLLVSLILTLATVYLCRKRTSTKRDNKRYKGSLAGSGSRMSVKRHNIDDFGTCRSSARSWVLSSFHCLCGKSSESITSYNSTGDNERGKMTEMTTYDDENAMKPLYSSLPCPPVFERDYKWSNDPNIDREEAFVNMRGLTNVSFHKERKVTPEIADYRNSDFLESSRWLPAGTHEYEVPAYFAQDDSFNKDARTARGRGAFMRQISLEDRRRQMALNNFEESVFGVVGAATINYETSSSSNPSLFPYNRHSFGYGRASRDADYCYSTSFTDDTLPPNALLLSQSSYNPPVQRRRRDWRTTSSSIRNMKTSSLGADQLYKLQCQNSQMNYKQEFDPYMRYSFHRSREELLQNANIQPSFEIDCSGSNIKVRYVGATERHLADGTSEGQGLKYSDYKVGSNYMDQATKVPFSSRTSKNQSTSIGEDKRTRPRSDATTSDALIFGKTPGRLKKRMALFQNGGKNFSSQSNVLSSPAEYREAPLRRAKEDDKMQLKSKPSELSIDSLKVSTPVEPHRYRTEIVVEPAFPKKNFNDWKAKHLSSECLQQLFDKQNSSSHSGSSCDLFGNNKPTVISVSDIPWETSKPREDTSSLISPISQISSQFSPRKSNSSQAITSAFFNKDERKTLQNPSPNKIWGSLERSRKLKKLSLPLSDALCPSTSVAELSASNMKPTPSSMKDERSLGGERDVRTLTQPGVRSLPLSPIKKFVPLKSRDTSCTKNNVPDALDKTSNSALKSSAVKPVLKTSLALKDSNPNNKSSSLMTSSMPPCVNSLTSLNLQHYQRESTGNGRVKHYTTQSPPDDGRRTGEGTRRDNSPVEENYEWDSEYAMEHEILEALRKFETLRTSSSLSEELRIKLKKFASDVPIRKQMFPSNQGSLYGKSNPSDTPPSKQT